MASETAVELLSKQMAGAFDMLRQRLAGLTEEEFLWEPAPGSWKLRFMPDGKWSYDYAIPDPDPAPLTTISKRLFLILESAASPAPAKTNFSRSGMDMLICTLFLGAYS